MINKNLRTDLSYYAFISIRDIPFLAFHSSIYFFICVWDSCSLKNTITVKFTAIHSSSPSWLSNEQLWPANLDWDRPAAPTSWRPHSELEVVLLLAESTGELEAFSCLWLLETPSRRRCSGPPSVCGPESTTGSPGYHGDQRAPHGHRDTTETREHHTVTGIPRRPESTTRSPGYQWDNGTPYGPPGYHGDQGAPTTDNNYQTDSTHF